MFDLQSKQWWNLFREWLESLVGGLKIGMFSTWKSITLLSPISAILGVAATLTSGDVSRALAWSAISVFVGAVVHALYRRQRLKTQEIQELLDRERAEHEHATNLLRPFLEIQEMQRVHPAGYVSIYPVKMGFQEVRHNDVPRPLVRFKIENYLLGTIEFVDPDAIECEVRNDERPGVLNIQPLTILTRYRSPLGRLCSNHVWMSYPISDATRQHLIDNNGLHQRWTYVPKWKFKIVETGEVFPVEVGGRQYDGVVQIGG